MYDRFTDRARKVLGLARQHAQRFNHDYIGTEHILLGLVQEGSGVAASVLKIVDVDLKKIREEVEKLVETGTTMVTVGQLPFTPRAKKVLELSLEEASNLGHTYIGTEHLLLGLIRESEGIAAQVLRNLKVKVEDVREEVLELLGAGAAEDVEPRPSGLLRRKNATSTAAPLSPRAPGHPALFGTVAEEALGHAIGLARIVGGDVEPVHVFLGVVHAARSHPELAQRTRAVVDLTTFAAHEEWIVAGRDREFLREDALSRRVDLAATTLAVLSIAIGEAAARGDSVAHVDDLLVALLSRDDSEPSRLLREAGVNPAVLREAVRTARRPSPEAPPDA